MENLEICYTTLSTDSTECPAVVVLFDEWWSRLWSHAPRSVDTDYLQAGPPRADAFAVLGSHRTARGVTAKCLSPSSYSWRKGVL